MQHIDPEGEGKTLIFAVRDSHADMIVDMLFEEYEAIGLDVHRDAIRKITGNVYDPLELTRLFRNEKYPPSFLYTVSGSAKLLHVAGGLR